MSKSSKPKTPWGLPGIFPRDMYKSADIGALISAIIVVPLLLEGEAQKFYLGMSVLHTFLMMTIDYEARGSSWLQRVTGLPISLPLRVMYYSDMFFTSCNLILPFKLKGFTNFSKQLVFYMNGMATLPFLFLIDYGDENVKKLASE
jgi:hypothetical protein